jgi:hypothetical protein
MATRRRERWPTLPQVPEFLRTVKDVRAFAFAVQAVLKLTDSQTRSLIDHLLGLHIPPWRRRRLANRRTAEPPVRCFLCERPPTKNRAVLGNTHDVYICQDCAEMCVEFFGPRRRRRAARTGKPKRSRPRRATPS